MMFTTEFAQGVLPATGQISLTVVLNNHRQPVLWGIKRGGWGRPNISATASSKPRTETAATFPVHSLCLPALAEDSLQVHAGLFLPAFRSRLRCRRSGRTPWGAGQSAPGGNPSTAKKSHFSVSHCGLYKQVEKCLLPARVRGSLKSVLMAWVKSCSTGAGIKACPSKSHHKMPGWALVPSLPAQHRGGTDRLRQDHSKCSEHLQSTSNCSSS